MNILVWFTGVISQYEVGDYDILSLKLNKSIYNRLKDNAQLFFIICAKDEQEKQDYIKLLSSNGMQECKLLFMPYQGLQFSEMMYQILQHVHKIDMYVDYSKLRLNEASRISSSLKLVHLSQLVEGSD